MLTKCGGSVFLLFKKKEKKGEERIPGLFECLRHAKQGCVLKGGARIALGSRVYS